MLYHNRKKGSLTVEAAIVLPVFLFAVFPLLFFFRILSFQEELQSAITETAQFASRYSYLATELQNSQENTYQEFSGLAAPIFFSLKTKEYLKEDSFQEKYVKGGLRFDYSTFLNQGEAEIDVVVQYIVRMPISFFSLNELPFLQRVTMKGFNGYRGVDGDLSEGGEDNTQDEDEIVYITDTGSVYHTSKECSHIKLSIYQIPYSEVEAQRNTNGGKYKCCEKCGGNNIWESNTTSYLATDGDRYHITLSCSSLKRSIREVKKSNVGNMPPCKRCGG